MADWAGGKHSPLLTPQPLLWALAPLGGGGFAPMLELPGLGSAQALSALSAVITLLHSPGLLCSAAFPESQGGFPASRGS